MIEFCIVGSGFSGSTISNLLNEKFNIQVYDKAKGIGGRASNKRFKKNLSFDHGLQYISPKSSKFLRFLNELEKKKIIKKWKGNHLDLNLEKKINKSKYIGKIGNNDINKFLLKNVKTFYQSNVYKIKFLKTYWNIYLNNGQLVQAKNLILTCPYPQVLKIAKKYLSKRIKKLKVKMMPNITIMVAFKSGHKIPLSSIKFRNGIVAWSANENSKKRFSSKHSLWTLQTSLQFSIKAIKDYKNLRNYYTNQIIKEFLKSSGFSCKNIIHKNIHGWKYSYSYKMTNLKSYWNKKYNFGVCGDWFLGPKAEDAWFSANDLYNKIKKTQTK